jgi:uncharacterized membrane protein YfcA
VHGRATTRSTSIEYLVLGLAALIIGVSKAGFGGGTGILVAPLLALLFPAKESVALMLPLLFACDIASLYFFWRQWDQRNVAILMPGALAGIILGTFALDLVSDELLKKSIGGLAIVFAVLQAARAWRRGSRPVPASAWLGFVVGLGTGFVSTLSHVGGILTVMYLLSQRMDNIRFVGTTTAVYFLINLAKIPSYLYLHMLNAEVMLLDLPFLPAAILGTALGAYLNRRVPGAWFARVVLGLVLLTGCVLLFGD